MEGLHRSRVLVPLKKDEPKPFRTAEPEVAAAAEAKAISLYLSISVFVETLFCYVLCLWCVIA